MKQTLSLTPSPCRLYHPTSYLCSREVRLASCDETDSLSHAIPMGLLSPPVHLLTQAGAQQVSVRNTQRWSPPIPRIAAVRNTQPSAALSTSVDNNPADWRLLNLEHTQMDIRFHSPASFLPSVISSVGPSESFLQ